MGKTKIKLIEKKMQNSSYLSHSKNYSLSVACRIFTIDFLDLTRDKIF